MKKYRIVEIIKTDGLGNQTKTYKIQKRCLFWFKDYYIKQNDYKCTRFNSGDDVFYNEKIISNSYKLILKLFNELNSYNGLKYKNIKCQIGFDNICSEIVYLDSKGYGWYNAGYGYSKNGKKYHWVKSIEDFKYYANINYIHTEKNIINP